MSTDQAIDLTPAETELWELAERSRVLGATIADLTAERDAITSRIRALAGIGEHPAGPLVVTVTQAQTFDARRAELILPADQLALITTRVVDAKLAKALLPPAVFDACRVPSGQPRVVIK